MNRNPGTLLPQATLAGSQANRAPPTCEASTATSRPARGADAGTMAGRGPA